jgi:hypothetical protein
VIPLSYFILHNLGSTSTVVSANTVNICQVHNLECLRFLFLKVVLGLTTHTITFHQQIFPGLSSTTCYVYCRLSSAEVNLNITLHQTSVLITES